MKHTARAALAVLLLVGVYVLGLAVVLGVVAIVVALARAGLHGALLLKGGIIALAVVIAVARGLFSRRRAEPEPVGVALTPEQEPALWAEVRELAAEAGTRPPDQIRLIPDVNAAVTETSRWLGLVGGTRTLYLGVPLVTGFTALQLRSVLAHELGHYSGRHTVLARITYRGSESLTAILVRLREHALVSTVFSLYAKLYFAVSSSVNRRQELEADAASARVAGGTAAASALRELEVLGAAWRHFAESYADVGVPGRARPAGLFLGFARFWAEPSRQDELAALRLQPASEEPTSVYDSHPATSERVRLLEAMDPDPQPDGSGPAHELLTDPGEALDRLEQWMYAGSELESVGWDDLVDRVAREHTHDHAVALTRALEAAAGERGANVRITLATVLDAVADGTVEDLVRPLLEPGTEGRPLRHATVNAVAGLLAEALLEAGAARFRVDWGGPGVLVDARGEALGLEDRVRAALADPTATEDLRALLVEHGVNPASRPDVPPVVDLAARAAGESVPVELHAAVAGLTSRIHPSLVLLNKGIVMPRGVPLAQMSSGNAGLLQHLVDTDPAEWGRRKGRFVPWAQVVEVRVGRTLLRRPCYDIHTRGGQRWRARLTLLSKQAGDVEGVLHAYLGDTLVRPAGASGPQR